MSSFSIDPYFDPIKQWHNYIENDVAMRMPYDFDDPLFLQKVSVLQAEQVKYMMRTGHFQIEKVGSVITNSLENGFAAMNYGFTNLSNKAEIANAFLSDINKGIELSNRYSKQLIDATEQINVGVAEVNGQLARVNNNLISINRSIYNGFSVMSSKLSVMNSKLDSILDELMIPESQRERRYHIQEGLKFLAQATKDNDDLYFEDALDEFTRALNVESKDPLSHYYSGYIYLYSKNHIDLDKATDHLRRYIHYAKVASSDNSLWNEGCYNLSLCYYMQGKLPDAIQTISKRTCDSEKLLLQHAKYLSLGNDSEKQQAMQKVSEILSKSPYAIMLLMQDKDILMNPFLERHIEKLRDEKYKETTKEYERRKQKGVEVSQYDKLLKQNTYLAAVEAKSIIKTLGGWIDLGLPSGTIWKNKNEEGGFYSFEQAVNKFGKKLPSLEQLQELKDKCQWIWNSSGYKVVGPNGNGIFLPTLGGRLCGGLVSSIDSRGNYWSSTPNSSSDAWLLNFSSCEVHLYKYYRSNEYSVRLVLV